VEKIILKQFTEWDINLPMCETSMIKSFHTTCPDLAGRESLYSELHRIPLKIKIIMR